MNARVAPTLSLGIRIAALSGLGVLAAVLLATVVAEFTRRGDARRAASEDLHRAHTLSEGRLEQEGRNLERLAATVARDPKFFALLALRLSERTATYRQSLEGVIRDFQVDVPVEIFDLTDEWGATVAASARPAAPEPSRGNSPLVRRALNGGSALGYRLEGGRLYRIAVVPVLAGGRTPIGTLTLGSPIGDSFASAVHATTGAELLLLAGEMATRGGATATARPIVSTLPQAGARSVLETLGPSPRAIGRSRLRDERSVWIAKTPGVALDVPLDGGMEGGVARLVVVVPVAAETAPTRETLFVAAAVAAMLVMIGGLVMGRRLARRLHGLGAASREAAIGNYGAELPEPARDEVGILTADFAGMREAQRREIDRLIALDQMKTDFLTVASREIAAPAHEIRKAGEALERRFGATLGLDGLARLRVIHDGASNLERIAHDWEGAMVVLTAAQTGAPRGAVSEGASAADASVTFVPFDAEFAPAVVPTAAPLPTSAAAPAVVQGEPETASPPSPPATRGAEVDIARLVEGVAVDFIPAAAERAVEVVIAVESRIVHPAASVAALEAAIRSHAERTIREMEPGSTITFGARQEAGAVVIRIEGGPAPLEIALPALAA